jgi:hypothetical protein
MTDQDQPGFQPIDQLPLLALHMTGGITMAEMNLSLLKQADTNDRRLTDADVATLSQEWALNRDELVELYVEQGRRWQALELSEPERGDVDRFVALVAKALQLSEEILTTLEELKGETVEAILAKGGDHLGLDKLLDEQQP